MTMLDGGREAGPLGLSGPASRPPSSMVIAALVHTGVSDSAAVGLGVH